MAIVRAWVRGQGWRTCRTDYPEPDMTFLVWRSGSGLLIDNLVTDTDELHAEAEAYLRATDRWTD